jgi:beta-lactam-binding protein with PASTA domain
VPNVVGLTLAAARQVLTQAGFFEGYPNEQSSSTVPAGQLISQSPAAGTSVLGGSTINVVLSTGAAKNSGGGGGAMDWLTLGALFGCLVAVRRSAAPA